MSTYIIKKVEQAALVSEPFKLKLLEHLILEPKTIKEVAELMELKQTRLYRHVDALLNAGLIKVVKEQQKRGTVEKHYQTIASRFVIDPDLFSLNDPEQNETQKIIRNIISETEQDLLSLTTNPKFNESRATVLKFSVEGSMEQIVYLQDKLGEWMAECEKISKESVSLKDKVSYKGLLSFYPEKL